MKPHQTDPVKLRERKTRTGQTSLYLEYYLGNGARKYEYLHLYLIPENNRSDKAKNAETMRFARDILAKRIVEAREQRYGFRSKESDLKFFPYFESLPERRRMAEASLQSWRCAGMMIKAFAKNDDITFGEIDKAWCQRFRQFLEKDPKLKDGTRGLYFAKFKTCLNAAVKDEILSSSPAAALPMFRAEESARMYLTIDELKQLIATPFRTGVREPFLFSCLTGLRYSDICRLRWSDVFEQGGFVRIIFRQKKTRGQEYLDISDQAVGLMGARPDQDGVVFPQIPSPRGSNHSLKRWTEAAGIKKHISFHCGRHTFATMMLDLGTDLYTVSRLLGHRDISTTQIYAKILDKNKQAAVMRIPKIL